MSGRCNIATSNDHVRRPGSHGQLTGKTFIATSASAVAPPDSPGAGDRRDDLTRAKLAVLKSRD
jgi:hypothetical protein